MVDEKVLRKVLVVVLIVTLLFLTGFLLRPIAASLMLGLLGAFVCYPAYKKVLSLVNSKNISAFLICLIALLIVFIPAWFFTPMVARQTIDIYNFIQKTNVAGPIVKLFPAIFSSDQLSASFSTAINNFIAKTFSSIYSKLTEILLSLPEIILQLAIIFIAFFFALRDGDKLMGYLSQISPFPEDSNNKFYERFKSITNSFLFGHIVIGIVQGIVTGIGLLIFGVNNTLILTLFAVFVGILPLIGPYIIWAPVSLYLLITGNTFAGIGMALYGLLVISMVDIVMRPFFVAYKTQMHTGMILIGMIAGLIVFGFLGLIIGPLILGYLLLILDFYKNKQFSKIFFE
jgi:predicted PurR-regulated permease PerM